MITNIGSYGGGGGGGENPFPAEQIILSGEDLSEEGYRSLETDVVLLKSDAPKLWEIYKNEQGDETFRIMAIPSATSDKKWWIKVE